MVLGSFKIENLVCNIGYIRAFSTFIAIMIISILVPILYNNILIWIIMRFCTGMSLAGLYIVLESWFLSIASKQNRGTYLSLYMAALGLGATIAPFFINISSAGFASPFIIAVLFLSSASIALTIQQRSTPEICMQSVMTIKQLFMLSKIGIIGCIVSGFAISSIQSLLPLILVDTNFVLYV